MRKGQFVGQIFVYILMLVVFAAILMFGFVSVKKLIDRGEDIEINKFKLDLKRLIDSNIHYGTTEVKVINIPAYFKEICFIDRDVYLDSTDPNYVNPSTIEFDERDTTDPSNPNKCLNDIDKTECYDHDKIKDLLIDFSDSNVFLFPRGDDNEFIGDLEIVHPLESPIGNLKKYNCMEIVDSKVKIRFEGKGDRVQLTNVSLNP
ncbi:MAG: hypothetical protein ABII01_06520 [Candidatus Woesearchaeota archaeon]